MKFLSKKSIFILLLVFFSSIAYYNFGIKESFVCTKVKRGDIFDSVTGNVRVLAEQTYQIKTIQNGLLSSIIKLPSAKSKFVKKNEILATLDSSDLNRSLNQAISSRKYLLEKMNTASVTSIQLENEIKELKIIDNLYHENGATLSQLDKKQNLVKQLQAKEKLEKISQEDELSSLSAKIDLLKSQIEKMIIRSPIEGEFIFSSVSPGDYLSSGQNIGTIISKERLIEASLIEEDCIDIKEGLSAAITLFTYGKKVIEGSVNRLSNVIDSNTGRRVVYLKVLDNSMILPTGSTGRVSIVKKKKTNCLLIPRKSLVGNSVFFFKDGKVSIRKINSGLRNLQKVEVMNGLNEGDIIVTQTPHLLNDKQKITPILSE